MNLAEKTKVNTSKGNPSLTLMKIQILQALLASLFIHPRALSHSFLHKDGCLDARLLMSHNYSLSQDLLLPNWRVEREKRFLKNKRERLMLAKTYVFSVVGRFVNLLVPPHTM